MAIPVLHARSPDFQFAVSLTSAAGLFSSIYSHLSSKVGQKVGPRIVHEARAVLAALVEQQMDARIVRRDVINDLLKEVVFEIDALSPSRLVMTAPDDWIERMDDALGNFHCRRCARLVLRAPHSMADCDDSLVFGILDA